MRKSAFGIMVLLLVAAGCAPQGPRMGEMSEGRSYEASGFSIPSLGGSGGTIDLAEYEGQVVLLDFWATWCPPCRAELPALNRLYSELKDEGFVLIGMTVDKGSVEQVASAVERFNLRYPVGLADEQAQNAYGEIRAVPTKFLLDREGAVQQRYVGVVSEEQLKADIEALLAL